MTIKIRPAALEDIPQIEELIVLSVRMLSASYYTEAQISSALTHIFGVDSQLIIDGTYYVAEVEGQIVGSGGWSKRATLFGGDQMKATGPDALLDPAKDAAKIRAFYVHPAWARKGIGKRILATCEEAVRRAGFRRVELMSTLPGEPLYSALGFTRLEPAEMKMPDGASIAGFIMEKRL